MQNKIDLEATQSEKYDFVMKIADGQFTFAQIKDWITEKAVQI
jgi:prophage maintenance system killer protein